VSKNTYLKAAKYCDEYDNYYLGACNCVEKFATGYANEQGWREDTIKFITMFRPRGSDNWAYWATKCKPKDDEELKQFRVLMLLFMHAMRQTGDV
jgi:hypothetical protein